MTKNLQQNLNEAIDKALRKIQSNNEKTICRYIPGPRGGYIHHFTFKKLKETEPEKCLLLIEQCILNVTQPRQLQPTTRAPRGVNRGNNPIKLPNDMVNRIIQMARETGDNSLLAKLLAVRPLNQIKRDLIRSIRNHKVNRELWEAYVEAVAAMSNE